MNTNQLVLLDKQGYKVIDEADFFILKRKLVKNKAKLYVFMPFSMLCFFLGFGAMNMMDLISVMALLITGFLLFSVPFWEYLISPFYSLFIDKKLRTILFRAVHSRAYRFSEITNISLGVSSRYADTNAFSNSNKEFDYRLDAHFGQSKEEIFSIIERDEISEDLIVSLKEYFENLFA